MQESSEYIMLQTWCDIQAAAKANLQLTYTNNTSLLVRLSLFEAIATTQWVWRISELSFDECWDDMPRQDNKAHEV